jgi:hypothetical protein
MIVLKKHDNFSKRIDKFLSKLSFKKATLCIIDIHNTMLSENNIINKDIFSLIKRKKYNYFYCSYDGNDKRIIFNKNILNKNPILQSIPKIFTKKIGSKGIIVKIIYDYFEKNIGFDKRYKYNLIFIDDKRRNIQDVNKFKYKKKLFIKFKNNLKII